MIAVLINNEIGFEVHEQTLMDVVRKICTDHGRTHGEVSLAIIDDERMHRLNRDYLQHDYPTDVLSFVLECGEKELEGEVIVSSETAIRTAPEYGWSAAAELLLYFIHGTLHLVGYDDHSSEDRHNMRQREVHYLRTIEIQPTAHQIARGIGERLDQEASA